MWWGKGGDQGLWTAKCARMGGARIVCRIKGPRFGSASTAPPHLEAGERRQRVVRVDPQPREELSDGAEAFQRLERVVVPDDLAVVIGAVLALLRCCVVVLLCLCRLCGCGGGFVWTGGACGQAVSVLILLFPSVPSPTRTRTHPRTPPHPRARTRSSPIVESAPRPSRLLRPLMCAIVRPPTLCFFVTHCDVLRVMRRGGGV